MANILLTQQCNQKCPYCFASYRPENESISFKNFKKAVEFISRKKNEKIGLLGGEPLMHPLFREFCDFLMDNQHVKTVVIYTNGLLLDRFIDKLNSQKFAILINCNEPEFYGKEKWRHLSKNIYECVKQLSVNNIQLGLNIYKNEMQIDEILNILKEIGMNKLRISISIPNEEVGYTQKDQFQELKKELLRIYEKLAEIDVLPQFDCNRIPLCYYSKEEVEYIKTLFGNKLIYTNILDSNAICSPVLDIYPDLTVCRCFGCTQLRCNLLEFRNTEDIKKYFINRIDKYRFDKYVYEQCKECYLNKTMNCMAGCMSYGIKE